MFLPASFQKPRQVGATILRLSALLMGLIVGQSANATGSGGTSGTPCEDVYSYTLAAQPEESGYWLSFKDTGQLPVNHAGGDKVLMLSIHRLNDSWLQVDAGLMADGNAHTWFAKIQMERTSPVRYALTFRPAPSMPMFAIELIPACKAA